MVEWLGWTATAIFAGSYFCKDAATLRRLQALAALLWLGYGIALQAAPIIVSNAIVALLALYSSSGGARRRPKSEPRLEDVKM